jgi:hypothetical protein
MDNAQHCQDQSAECLRLMRMAQNAAEAELLKYIAQSWSRLAGQIDRYEALERDQRASSRNKAVPVGCPEVAMELPPSRPIGAVHETKAP